jgi:hypothetical protein
MSLPLYCEGIKKTLFHLFRQYREEKRKHYGFCFVCMMRAKKKTLHLFSLLLLFFAVFNLQQNLAVCKEKS